MVTVDQIINELLTYESEFNRIYKCLNKTILPKRETVEQHLKNILSEYNKIKSIYFQYNNVFNYNNQLIVLEILTKSHKRLLKVFKRLRVYIQVPSVQVLKIPKIEIEDSDSETEDENNFEEMAITVIDFINFASKTIPEFDGTPKDLQRFLDAVNLVKANVGENEVSAVEVVKTKLKGTARNFISNEATLKDIVDKLKLNIKPESTKLIIAKMKNLKQFNKNPNDYVKEIETLSESLKTAYISEGLPITLAETYTTENVVQSIKSTSIDDKVTVVLEAGKFNSVSEVTEKFLSVKSEKIQNNAQINYFQRKNFSNNSYRKASSFSQGNRNFYRERPNSRFSYFDNKNKFRNNRGNYNSFSNRGNPGRKNFSRNVRYLHTDSENSVDPQSTQNLQLRDM